MPREGEASLTREHVGLGVAQPGQPRVPQPAIEGLVRLVGMAEGELGATDHRERGRVPAAELRAQVLLALRGQPALDPLEELGGLGAAGERGRIVSLGVGHLGETVEQVTLGLVLPSPTQPGPGERDPFLERRAGPGQVADRPVRRAELRVHRRPRAEIGRSQPTGRLEHLDRAAPVLDDLLEAPEPQRGHRRGVPRPGRARLAAVPPGLLAGTLVVREGLAPLATVDGLVRRRPVERVLAGAQRLLGALLALRSAATVAPLAAAARALRFRGRAQRDEQQRAGQQSGPGPAGAHGRAADHTASTMPSWLGSAPPSSPSGCTRIPWTAAKP